MSDILHNPAGFGGGDGAFGSLTVLLAAVASGDREAVSHLWSTVHGEVRAMAASVLRGESVTDGMGPTVLVHEAWLRLHDRDDPPAFENRRHFFGAAAEAMRRILIERARKKGRLKHGGDHQRVELEEPVAESPLDTVDLLALDEALEKLAREDPPKAELVKLRFFAGLTMDQVAQALDLSPATVDRHWAYARAYLFHEIQGRGTD